MHSIARSVACLFAALFLLTAGACSDDSATAPDPSDETTTHRLYYQGNGADAGTAPVDTTGYETGATAIVATAGTLTRTDHVFDGWNTEADGAGTAHAPGDTVVMGDADITLYATWAAEQTEPDGWDPTLGSWAYLSNAGAASSGEAVNYCRIALDTAGEPVAAFTLVSPGFAIPTQQAVHWNGSSFTALGGSPDLVQDVRRFFDLTCDADDRIWIATTDGSDNGRVYCYESDAWSTPYEVTSDAYTFQAAFTLDQTGAPVLALRTRPSGVQTLAVLRRVGTQWTALPGLETGLDNNLAIAMINDEPYVMYANPMQYGHVTRHVTGAGWQAVGASPMHPSNSVNSYAMTVDSQGRPWVVYRQGGDVYVRWFDGTDWVAVDTEALENIVDTSSWPETMDIVLIDDVPVIAFKTTTGARGIRVMAYVDEAWVNLAGLTTVGPSGSHYPQLAVADDGVIYLGYSDADAGGAMSIQAYTPAD